MTLRGYTTGPRRPYRHFTPEESAELCRLWPTGLPSKVIARRLNRSINSLDRRAKKLGLGSRVEARIEAFTDAAARSFKPGPAAEARHDGTRTSPASRDLGSAASAPPPIPATFDEWWAGEKARMRRAKMAAPHVSRSQGPPYLDERFERVLARSLADEG